MKRISVDIGGTFTDCFVAWDGRYIQAKALTTHHNLSQGFNEALDQACTTLSLQRDDVLREVDSVRYATTLGTNALIERRGPQVGVIVTAGFEATIPLSRGRGYGEGLDELARNDMSSGTRPDPLVPQTLIRSVAERVDYSGTVLMDLDREDIRQALRELIDAGAEALVVCLTNATENPAHELRVQEVFLAEYPAHQLGAIPMLLSHQLSGRKGEYVRATSAIVDAFLHATMYHALSDLEQNLREHGYPRPMLIIHNSGGMAQLNSTDALQTIHSGPVAGISASEHLAGQAGLGNVVATDMGGTSYDIGLVPADGVKHYDFMPVIDRWLVSVPMIHLVTLGAGGGSIASYDRLHQSVKVGPRSAGSDPGPACYDRGGLRPTVTDADLLLGYLTPERYAGGQIKLNRQRAEFAVDEEFGDHLDLDPVEVARLIKAEVDEQMANGLAKELRIRGYLPTEFTMLAYGGNGPLHCCGIAAHLGMDKILAPPYSSVFSALGAGNMPQLHIHERSVPLVLFDATTPGDVHRLRPLQRDRSRARGQGPRRPAAAGAAGGRGPAPARARHALRQPAGDDGRGRGEDPAGQRARRRGPDAVVLRRLRAPVRRGQPVSRGRHPGHRACGSRPSSRARRSNSTPPRRMAGSWPPARSGRGAASSPAPKGRRKPPSTTRARSSRDRPCPARPSSPRPPPPTSSNPAGGSRPARTAPSGSWPAPPDRRIRDERAQFTAEEQEWVDAFLAETTLFLGPDPEIMNDHRMAPRTAEEDRLLSGPVDANDLDRVRKRIVAGLDEAFEMMEQTGAAPGAKWGDLTSAVYSASGDLIHISTGGVLAFASVLHYPVRFINKYWISDADSRRARRRRVHP